MSIDRRKNRFKKTLYRARVWDGRLGYAVAGKWTETREEAEKDERFLRSRLKEGKSLRKWTVDEILNEWLRDPCTGDRKLSKKRTCENVWKLYLKEYFGGVVAEDVSVDRVNEVQQLLLARKKTRRGEGTLMLSTVHKAIMTLHWIYEYGIKKGWVFENPVKGSEKTQETYRGPDTKTVWNNRELSYFLGYLDYKELKYRHAFRLLSYTGMRPSEVCALKKEDINLAERKITLQRGIDKFGNTTGMKTKGSHRFITGVDRNLLRSILKEGGKEWLFESSPGKPVTPELLSTRFKNDLRAINKQTPLSMWVPDHFVEEYNARTLEVGTTPEDLPKVIYEAYKGILSLSFVQNLHGEIIEDDHDATAWYLQQHRPRNLNAPFDPPILPHLTLYGLRHTFATRMIELGRPIGVIASTIGNKPSTIQDYYFHQTKDASVIGQYTDWISQAEEDNKLLLSSAPPALPSGKQKSEE